MSTAEACSQFAPCCTLHCEPTTARCSCDVAMLNRTLCRTDTRERFESEVVDWLREQLKVGEDVVNVEQAEADGKAHPDPRQAAARIRVLRVVD